MTDTLAPRRYPNARPTRIIEPVPDVLLDRYDYPAEPDGEYLVVINVYDQPHRSFSAYRRHSGQPPAPIQYEDEIGLGTAIDFDALGVAYMAARAFAHDGLTVEQLAVALDVLDRTPEHASPLIRRENGLLAIKALGLVDWPETEALNTLLQFDEIVLTDGTLLCWRYADDRWAVRS